MSQEPLFGASPATPPMFREIGAVNRERAYAYRSLTPYAWATLILLGAYVAVILGAFAVGFLGGAGILEGPSPGLLALASGAVLGTRILCAIAGGFWIYNAACNVRALGGSGFEVSPGWAVGFYAIPIASFFKPFQAMNEIERASRAPHAWRAEKTRLLLRLWWAAWLIAGLGGSIINFLQRTDPGEDAQVMFGLADIGVTVVDLTATGLFFAIVLGVSRAQVETRARGSELDQVFA